jgi:hypothetical protein
MGTNRRRVNIELGPDLQDEYEYWLEAKRSLCTERSINSFLNFISVYGTHNNPKDPDKA